MLITFSGLDHKEEVKATEQLLRSWDIHPYTSVMQGKTVIGFEATLSEESIARLKETDGIEDVFICTTPYKMVSSAFSSNKTVIQREEVCIGGKKVVLMAGPCAIESREQMRTIAMALKDSGVSVLRGCAFKARSSPYAFQGMGLEGLKIHKELQEEHGMLIETEVMDVRDVALVSSYVDIVRVGARNMQNFNLLKEVGSCGRPVILKRGLAATLEEWLMSAEYIMAHGNHEVILCERGIRTFESSTRYTLDLSSVALAKQLTHLPIIVDPSHAAGRRDLIPALSKAAVAVGADGLLIEVHHCPSRARCDGMQALLPEEFNVLSGELQSVALSIGRSL